MSPASCPPQPQAGMGQPSPHSSPVPWNVGNVIVPTLLSDLVEICQEIKELLRQTRSQIQTGMDSPII